MNITWLDEYAARFRTLSSHEAEVWEEILANEIRNLGTGEIARAVRLLGEEKQQGKHKYAPSVEDLKSAIVKNRWLSSPRRDGPQQSGCALCQGNGWMPFGASQKQGVLSLGVAKHIRGDGWAYGVYATPCLCTLGERQLNAYRPAERGKVMELSKRVFEFKKTITADSPVEDRLVAADEG